MKGILHILLIGGLMLVGACQSKQQMIENADTVQIDDNLPQWAELARKMQASK